MTNVTKLNNESDHTAHMLRILADQLERNDDDTPDFFLVVSPGNMQIESAERTLNNPIELLGAIEQKVYEFKLDMYHAKESV